MTPSPGFVATLPSFVGSSSVSDGSSATHTTTYIWELSVGVGSRLLTSPYANSCQRGLFVAHGLSSVFTSISAGRHPDVLPQFIRLVAWPRSNVKPPGIVLDPLGGPSTKAE